MKLGAGCERHGLEAAGGHFRQMETLLGQTLQEQELPDPALGERLWHLVEEIGEAVPMTAEPMPVASAARGELAHLWVAVVGRPALQRIRDVHALARRARGREHRIEQLARAADERLAAAVFLGTGRLADDHPARVAVADAEHRLRAAAAEFAGLAGGDGGLEGVPVEV